MRTSPRRASLMRERANVELPLPRWVLGYRQDQPRLKPRAHVVLLQKHMAARMPAIATPCLQLLGGTQDFQLSSHHHFGQEWKHRAHVQLPRVVVLDRAACHGPSRLECGQTQFFSCCCRVVQCLGWNGRAPMPPSSLCLGRGMSEAQGNRAPRAPSVPTLEVCCGKHRGGASGS
ncbi:unnamed protein product [Symbiodinium sp. CCMP2592]|nr:unnamed protein product [Symbiodinium sp. CCMP2592]